MRNTFKELTPHMFWESALMWMIENLRNLMPTKSWAKKICLLVICIFLLGLTTQIARADAKSKRSAENPDGVCFNIIDPDSRKKISGELKCLQEDTPFPIKGCSGATLWQWVAPGVRKVHCTEGNKTFFIERVPVKSMV